MKKEQKEVKQTNLEKNNIKENIFTIRSYEATNKTIDSFSDIDDFSNSKNMSNINISNIFENVAKEKSIANPFTFKTILEDVTQDSILEKSNAAFKKKNLDDRPLKKSNLSQNIKEENNRYNNESCDTEEKMDKYLKNISNFDKIRSVTPKIERSKITNAPGSTRSITPLEKGEREFSKPNAIEKSQKTPQSQNDFKNKPFLENKSKEKNPEKFQKDNFYMNKMNFVAKNEYLEQNKENIFEKKNEYNSRVSKFPSNKEINQENSFNFCVKKNETKENSKFKHQKSDKTNDFAVSIKYNSEYARNLEEELEKKNSEIYDLKKNNRILDQENSNLRDQIRKNSKDKSFWEEDVKRKQSKMKEDLFELEQQNFGLIKEVKELKKENDEKSQLIKNLLLELDGQTKHTEKKNKIEHFFEHKIYKEDEEESNEDASFLKNQYLKEKKLLSKKFQDNHNDINEKFANIFKNLHVNELNEPNSVKKPPLDINNIFSTKNNNQSNAKRKENESSIKLLEIIQKNNSKEIGPIKTTPDNLSSKRNRKGHISPIDFPSSRNNAENSKEKSQKISNYLESFNSHNINNLFSEDRFKVPSTNPHKYRENPLFFVQYDEMGLDKNEKNYGKKILAHILEEKNFDLNHDMNSKNNASNKDYSKKKCHSKNDSSSNSSYLSYLQKKNNQNSDFLNENEKSDNGSAIFIQSSPRKFNKNLNEVIIDISKRCQTSSNSHLQKIEKSNKEKSLEKNHSNANIIDFKNRNKDPILPKPRNFNERNNNFNEKNEVINKNPYLSTGQNRRSSLNMDIDQSKKGVPSKNTLNEILNSTKKERSKSIFNDKYNKDD